jgi:hypothetical protein
MSFDKILLSSVVILATACAVIKFALIEYEGVVHVWREVSAKHRNRETRISKVEPKPIDKGTHDLC